MRLYIYYSLRIFIRKILYKLSPKSMLFYFFDLKLNEILEKIFSQNTKFCFIQIGANDGVSHDWLFDFIKKRNSFGIVVEPLPDFFIKLKENYHFNPNIIPLEKAISNDKDQVVLYRVSQQFLKYLPDWAGGIASFSKSHLLSSGVISESQVVEQIVSAIKLNAAIEQYYNCDKIDLLQIDVEGYDWEVLRSLDFEKYSPRFIKIEHVNLSSYDVVLLKQLLRRKKYLFYYEGPDIIAIKY